MATLKELLRAESLVGGARGAALDTSTYTSITPPAKGSSVDYIAPANGELHVTGEYKTTDAWNSLWTFTNGAAQIGFALGGATGWIAFKTRLKKGDRVTVGNSGETIVATVGFFRAIGGGYKRYLPSLSCNRFGGALWLRLKTTSETLPRLVAGSRSRLSVASSSRASHLHLAREIASTCRQQTVFASFGLRVPVSTLRFANPVAHNLSRQTVLQAGRKLVFLVPVDKSSTMRLGVRSSEGSSTSSLLSLSVASNNARMEVAA